VKIPEPILTKKRISLQKSKVSNLTEKKTNLAQTFIPKFLQFLFKSDRQFFVVFRWFCCSRRRNLSVECV